MILTVMREPRLDRGCPRGFVVPIDLVVTIAERRLPVWQPSQARHLPRRYLPRISGRNNSLPEIELGTS